MAYDEVLADKWRHALAGTDNITEKRMMGGICFMYRGNMLGSTRDERFMFRVGKDNEAKALKRKGASRVVMGSREMVGFIHVNASDCTASAFKSWVDMVVSFVEELPAK